MNARYQRRPAPLRYHFGLTAAITGASLFMALVVLHTDPAILGGSASSVLLLGTGGGGRHRLAASSRWESTWQAWRPAVLRVLARVRRVAVLSGRWLLSEDHALTVLQLGAVAGLIVAAVVSSPGPVPVLVVTVALVAVVVLAVLAGVHRRDPIRSGSLLGRRGGAR